MNLVTLLNCCPQGILVQSPAKLEMNSSSVVTCAQLDALCCCGSFPLSQNGFSSPNIAACRVLRAKLQLSSCALLRHFLAPAKALKQKVCRWLRVIYWSIFKQKFLKSSDDGLSHSWTILFRYTVLLLLAQSCNHCPNYFLQNAYNTTMYKIIVFSAKI